MGNDKAEREKRHTPSPTKQSQGGAKPSYSTSIVWANVRLSLADKARLREEDFDAGRTMDHIAFLVETGHKFVFTPKNDKGFVGASVLGVGGECPNSGCGLSGEGGTLFRALQCLFFKLDLLDGDLHQEGLSSGDDFR